MDTNRVATGDAFDVLADLPSESVHAVVTDPPYGLNFMGKDWDNFRRKHNEADSGRDNVFGRTSSTSPAHGAETEGKRYQQWCEEWATLALDVLKPGGHLLAFSGNRTHHRLFSGVEDAGFEVRDTLTWHYGSGFPKALDVSKAIKKSAGMSRKEAARILKEERKAAGMSREDVAEAIGASAASVRDWEEGRRRSKDDADVEWVFPNRERHEALAELFDEYPSPLEIEGVGAGADRRDDGTVIGLGHSGTQTEYTESVDAAKRWSGWKTHLKPATEFVVLARKPFEGTVAECMQTHGTAALNIDSCRIGNEPHEVSDTSYRTASTGEFSNQGVTPDERGTRIDRGRYPANVIFDAEAAAALDRDVGDTTEHNGESWSDQTVAATQDTYGDYDGDRTVHSFDDSGGPSRYFYTSKASRAERTLDGRITNAHPTVKPADLMEWLVKLVTAEGQVVLDPFCGSGTTLKAAKDLGRQFVGIEQNPKWADVARVRAGLTPVDPSHVRDGDKAQQGLEAFTDGGGAE